MARAKEDGVMLPGKGASGYDSPGFARAKAAVQRQMRDDAQERRN